MSSDSDSPQRLARVSPPLDVTEVALDAAELWRLSKLTSRPGVRDAILRLYADIGARLAQAQQASTIVSPPASARKRKQLHDSPSTELSKKERLPPSSPSVTDMAAIEGPKETPKSARRATTNSTAQGSQLTPMTKKARDAQRKARKRAAQDFLVSYAATQISEKEKDKELNLFCSDELKKASLRSLVAGVLRNDGDFKWLAARGEELRNLVIDAARTLLKNPVLASTFNAKKAPKQKALAGKVKSETDGSSEVKVEGELPREKGARSSASGSAAASAHSKAQQQYYDDEESASGEESEADVVEFRSDFARHDESEDEEEEEEDEEEEEEDEEEDGAESAATTRPNAARLTHRSLVYTSPLQTK